MQGNSISEVTKNILVFFNETINQIGKETQFVKRKDKAKLDAKLFAQTLIENCLLDDKMMSLEQMCSHIKGLGVMISKSGLHQRFNQSAEQLMAACLSAALNRFKGENKNVIGLLKGFKEVSFLDSTSISLPSSMGALYKGCGGSGSLAGLKIQMLYNYVENNLESLTFTEGCKPDQAFQSHLDNLKAGVLYLQDLGYFRIKSFEMIHKKGSFFISRYFANTKLYDKNDHVFDLLGKLNRAENFFSSDVWLGTEKVPIRLIAQRLPEAKVQERLRKLRKQCQKEGREPKKETLELAKWSICITNISKEMLIDEQVYLVYSLRWQIELFFKLCKQEANINKIKSAKASRVLCEIYAKLICVILLLYLCFPVRWQDHREISFPKAYQHLRKQMIEFFKSLISPYRFKKFLKNFWDDLKSFAMKDIKRKKPATYQKLINASPQAGLQSNVAIC